MIKRGEKNKGKLMDWAALLGAFLTGLASGWTLRIYISKRSMRVQRKNKVVQTGNVAGGNIVGGDLNSQDKKP